MSDINTGDAFEHLDERESIERLGEGLLSDEALPAVVEAASVTKRNTKKEGVRKDFPGG
jgi:hypothetical protein